MKNKITLLAMLLASSIASKAQITINASDIPLPGIVNIMEYAGASTLPNGANQNWNIASNPILGPSTITYIPEAVPFWVNLGAEVYRVNSKYLTNALTYNIFLEFDKNATGFSEIGFNVPAQSYSIGSFTGSNTDSIILADQDVVYTSAKTIIPFPMTATSSFVNTGRRVVSFTINAPGLGLSNTPFTHVLNEVRRDSVIGWGIMRVYIPGGVSQGYDVLMDRITNYSLDSFYMAGSPAPVALTTAFGVTQGQKVNFNNAINFYRKGQFSYLYRLFYGDDNTFSTISGAFSHLDDLSLPTSINEKESMQFASILYPNPSINSDIHIKLIGAKADEFTNCVLTTTKGECVKLAALTFVGDEVIVPTKNLAAGMYCLQLRSSNSERIISEKFEIK